MTIGPTAPRDLIAEWVARLVAEAPRFTPAKLAELSLIMGSVPIAEMAAERAGAEARDA